MTRVRFAPSPTGGLHIGGLRTALFNYLFARKQGGSFILRIEDTDQKRYVKRAENYIVESLDWLGITPDEGPSFGGDHGPYRQSERKHLYQDFIQKLLKEGNAYYAFDTPDELEAMRVRLKASRITNPQYDSFTRTTMCNSLTLSEQEVKQKIDNGEPYVIRVKIPEKEEIRFKDLVRGWVMVRTEVVDDKVLVKSDGMPTYHLANVVDDYLMKITHVIRGEEWLPSAPLHVLLYQLLNIDSSIPEFAHLPLILKPDGNGKLSKRAADKAGFPIYPLDWQESDSEKSIGFRELGFLPDAFANFLSLLGWNPGTEREIFEMEELINAFSLEKVNKAGTKFDFDKAKWFNQSYIQAKDPQEFLNLIKKAIVLAGIKDLTDDKCLRLIAILQPRVTYSEELVKKGIALLKAPVDFDQKTVKKKWSETSKTALLLFAKEILNTEFEDATSLKEFFWKTLEEAGFKPGQHMQPLRLAITGDGSGPDLMELICIIGAHEASSRIKNSIQLLDQHIEIP
ncbi:MAG: glutamate--tRNA ligase [Bacteroidota bacterium]